MASRRNATENDPPAGEATAEQPEEGGRQLQPFEGRAWCALHTRARHEKKIAARCGVLRVPHYLPLRLSRTFSGGKVNRFEVPMFPGYVFAALRAGEAGELKRTNSLAQQIPTDDEAGLLRDLRNVRAVEQSRLELELCTTFHRGERVMIGQGPLCGISGTVFRQKNRTRLQVRVEAIGQTVVVDVSTEALVRLD